MGPLWRYLYWQGGLSGGRGGPPLLAAPDAPTLTLTSGATDNTPELEAEPAVGEVFEVGDTLRLLYSQDSGLAGASTLDNEIDAGEEGAQLALFETGTLADGTWYFGLIHIKPGHEDSAVSDIESVTINTTAPMLDFSIANNSQYLPLL